MRHRWENSHPALRLVLLAGLAGLFLLLVVRPSYHFFKRYRMSGNLNAAASSMKSGNLEEARDLALAVIQSGGGQIAACRIVEHATGALGDSRHLQSALGLLAHPEAIDSDRLTGFRVCCDEMPMAGLGGVWLSLPQHCREEPAFAVAFADRQISDRMLEEAVSVLLSVPEAKRDAPLKQRLVRIMLRTGRPGDLEQAQRRIESQWCDEGGAAEGWLKLIEEIPLLGLRPDLLRGVEMALDSPAHADSPRHRMALARIRIAAEPLARERIVSEVVSLWRETGGPWLARFLLDAGCGSQVLEIMPPEQHMNRPEMLPLLVEAAELSKSWEVLRSMLETASPGLPSHERHGRLAVMCSMRGDDLGFDKYSRSALSEAKFSHASRALLDLHDLYARQGMQDEAETAMVEAILYQKGPLPAYRLIDPMVRGMLRRDQEDLALRICASYIRLEPGDAVLTVLYAYLAVMNDLVGPETFSERLRAMAAEPSDKTGAKFVFAAICLHMGRVQEAAAALDGCRPDAPGLEPSQRACVLATMLMSRRIKARDAGFKGFSWNELLPSERRKFKTWILKCDPEAFAP